MQIDRNLCIWTGAILLYKHACRTRLPSVKIVLLKEVVREDLSKERAYQMGELFGFFQIAGS